MELRAGRQDCRHIRMIMAENEIIHMAAAGIFESELVKRFILTLEHIFLMTGKTVAL